MITVFKNKLNLLIIPLLLLAVGCGDYLSDDKYLSGEAESYDGFMEEGWAEFSSGDYEAAAIAFQSAAERDATQPEVYLGLGWSQLRLMDLANAESNFQKVLSFAFLDEANTTSLTNDANAGLTFLKLATSEYASVISFGNMVLAQNSAYQFSKDNTIDSQSLLIAIAEAHFYLDQISDAFTIMISLGISFSTVTAATDGGTVQAYYSNSAIDGLVSAAVDSVDHLLITVESAIVSGLSYDIAEIYEGTIQFDIIGNPVPSLNSAIIVEYYYTTDYAEFLVELISKITQ